MTESGFASGKRESMACSFGSCSDAEQMAERRDPFVHHLDLVISVEYGKNADSRSFKMRDAFKSPSYFFA